MDVPFHTSDDLCDIEKPRPDECWMLHGRQIYVESYHIVPKGVCRNLVKYMAWCFYISWVGFPIIFVAGPDGLGKLSIWAEVAGSQSNPKP